MKKILLAIVLAVVVIFAGGMTFFLYGMENVKNASVSAIDFSVLNDGTYTGRFRGARWSNQVEVTVRDREIADIRIIKDQMIKIPEVTDTVLQNIKEMQTLQIDTVSGASISTKAYLKAVEDALTQSAAK